MEIDSSAATGRGGSRGDELREGARCAGEQLPADALASSKDLLGDTRWRGLEGQRPTADPAL